MNRPFRPLVEGSVLFADFFQSLDGPCGLAREASPNSNPDNNRARLVVVGRRESFPSPAQTTDTAGAGLRVGSPPRGRSAGHAIDELAAAL